MDTVQRIPAAVLDLLYIEERVSATGPTLVGLHTTLVVESTWIRTADVLGAVGEVRTDARVNDTDDAVGSHQTTLRYY